MIFHSYVSLPEGNTPGNKIPEIHCRKFSWKSTNKFPLQLSTMFFSHLIRVTFVGKKDPNILRNRTLLPQKAKIVDFVKVKHLMIRFLFYHIPPHILPYVSHMFPLFSHLSPQMLRWSESRAPRFIRATAQPSRLKWFALGRGYFGPFGLVTMRNSVITWYNKKMYRV